MLQRSRASYIETNLYYTSSYFQERGKSMRESQREQNELNGLEKTSHQHTSEYVTHTAQTSCCELRLKTAPLSTGAWS
jgi:hypothetical protein